jgi:signal transduction histidine kinase
MNTPFLKLSQNKLSRSILLFSNYFLAPKSYNEDERRRELILNILLSGTIFLLLISGISLVYNRFSLGQDYAGLPITVFAVIFAFFIILYSISRAGYFIISSYLFVSVYLLATVYFAYIWGIDPPSVVLSYALIIVIASILINTRFGLVMTLILSGVITFLIYLTQAEKIHPITDWKAEYHKLNDALVFTSILLLIWVVSWLSNREIEKSLQRARRSERALKEERDLLEIKVEERTRELKHAQLEKMEQLYRFAEFGKLSSGLFHDLINPLTALALNLERLKKNPENYDDSKPYLDKAITASRKMDSFISALRRQIQKQEIKNDFVLNQEIEQALELLGYKARKSKVHLRLVAPQKLRTYGNPLKFYQIVVNLVSNAIDAYDEAISDISSKQVLVSLHEKEGSAVFIVKDWAMGIADDVQPQIFDAFFTTKSVERGSGIGLATVKQIVEVDFGGTIELSSKLGHGAMFTVIFKLKTIDDEVEANELLI